MTGPDSWRPHRHGDAVHGDQGWYPDDRHPVDGRHPYPDDDHRSEPPARRSRPSRLQRREVERRRQARRRRRYVVLSLLVAATVLAGVDFARGGVFGPTPVEPQAGADGRYINPPDPANEPPPSSPAGSPSPTPSKQPSVPYSGSGKFVTAGGQSDVLGNSGSLLRYKVQVEKGIDQDPAEFAEYVDTTLGDKRSWIAGGDVRFQRTVSGPYDFTVVLATPTTTDKLCAPLQTSGFTSCRQGDNVVVNVARWVLGVEHWDADLETYRRYVINHEVGHRLGHRHELCSGEGDPAPVMQQQTLKLAGCTGNAWPYLGGKLHKGPPGSYGGT